MKKFLMTLMLAFVVMTQTACWETADEGTVKVQTIYGKITKVLKGGESIWTITTWGDDYYPVNLRSETIETPVGASTKDNAALQLAVATSVRPINQSDADVQEYVRKFGLDEKERAGRRDTILKGQVNTETKNVLAQYDAYGLLANQEKIQKEITDRLRPIFRDQLNLELESVQIIGRPDFLDDRIEQAASQVVANQKLKEASQAALEAARIDAEKKQVEAATYANPQMARIKELELQVEIADRWSKHQGPLVFGGNSPTMLNMNGGK